MKTIHTLINDVLAKEGGYVNHPNDKGGPTKYGITLKTLEQWRQQDLEARDVELLSQSEAAEIYEQRYYLDPGINHLPDALQPLVFDMAVNHGSRTAVKLLQSELMTQGYTIGRIDGIIGHKTTRAASGAITMLGQTFINRLVDRRVNHYLTIIKNDPKQAAFKNGWLARAESFRPGATA